MPDVQLSTFQKWQEVSSWYDSLQRSQIAPTPEVRAKAIEITRGAVSDDERARRLYAFVSKNIRYVSLSFGIGRYQPHAAGEVLHNQYGDCKDKHTLLAALLESCGISSHAVLIHSSNDLDAEVPTPSQFDHLITAADVGGKRVWLDSTSGVAAYGFLFPNLRGKHALLIQNDVADPLVQTPESAPVVHGGSSEVTGQFTAAGDFEADMTLSLQGDTALIFRTAARQTPETKRQELVQAISYGSGFAGIVSEGWALAYRKYSMEYVPAEDRARSEKRGMWAGMFVSPEEWRKGNRVLGEDYGKQ